MIFQKHGGLFLLKHNLPHGSSVILKNKKINR